ncbi:MAG TPA: SMC-Scp complex subunit ScpB, partial [Solirubrobacteraceae bacterium]|nr:SMC-Scp complex subunit ScpB [Solirubrobacteraceae bacterium]
MSGPVDEIQPAGEQAEPTGDPVEHHEPVQGREPVRDHESARDGEPVEHEAEVPSVARAVEALLFLSADPLSPAELADATQVGEGAIHAALALLAEQYAPGLRGIVLRELGGGWTFASDPSTEDAARRLFSRPRISTLTPAQA